MIDFSQLQDIEDELSSKRQEEANRQHKIAELKVQLTALESELEQIESDENVQVPLTVRLGGIKCFNVLPGTR